MNDLMADLGSVVGGIATNPLFSAGAGFPDCIDCGFDTDLHVNLFPGIVALFYDWDEPFEVTGLRLAAGTYTFNSLTNRFDYSSTPASALVIAWPHAASGESMQLRVDWQDLVEVRTYDQALNFYVPGVPLYSPDFLAGTVLEVPQKITVSATQDSDEFLHLDLQQSFAATSCGVLMEFRTVTASGFFKHGSQAIELERFVLDHSSDEAISIELRGSAASGSLRVPFSLETSFAAGAVTRDPVNCQLNGIEGPYAGDFALQAGSADSGVGIEFDWRANLAAGSTEQLDSLEISQARLKVGRKHADLTGSVGADTLNGYGDDLNIRMTFEDQTEVSLLDFVQGLNFPVLP